MASKDPEEPSNTDTEEETLALKKKRARRVSFADVEITSVHIFNRDEDYETPPDPQNISAAADNDVPEFFRDSADRDDSRECSPNLDDYGEIFEQRKSFLRPIGSPSPGSSTVGSATSNDEENFFGPVSSSFIRPGRLSDSAASDENHDVTMDSTAFSMHFRSLAQSDVGGGDLKTPTSVRLAFEEKTPSQSTTPENPESFMILTNAKKLISQSLEPVNVVSGGKDSNDMSIVGENPHRYDYGRISPTLDALLTEGSKDLYTVSVTEKSPKGSKISTEKFIHVNKPLEVNVLSNRTLPDTRIKVPHLDLFAQVNLRESMENRSSSNDQRYKSDDTQNYGIPHASPLKLSILSLSAGRKTFLGTPNLSRHEGILTPDITRGIMVNVEDVSSINKSISKFKIPEPSPFASSLKEGIEKLRSRISSYSSMRNLNSAPPDSSKDPQCKYVDIPVVCLEEQLSSVDMKNEELESVICIDSKEVETPKDFGIKQIEEIRGLGKVGESPKCMSTGSFSKRKPTKPVVATGSPSELTWSEKRNTIYHFSTEFKSHSPGLGSPGVETRLHSKKEGNPIAINDKLDHSLVERSEKSLASQECLGSFSGGLSICDLQSKPAGGTLGKDKNAVENAITDAFLERVNDGGIQLSQLQNKSETFSSFQTSSREREILNSQLESPDKRRKVDVDPQFISSSYRSVESSPQKITQSPSKKVVIESSPKNDPKRSPSNREAIQNLTWNESSQGCSRKKTAEILDWRESNLSASKTKLTWDSTIEESTQSLLRKDFSDILEATENNIQSPSSNFSGQDNHDHHQGRRLSQSSSEDTQNLSGKKRRYHDTVSQDRNCGDMISIIHRSPDVYKRRHEEQSNDLYSGRRKIGDDTKWKHWTEISAKFLEDTKDLISPLVDKLNLRVMDSLEVTLSYLVNVKKYEILCSDIQSKLQNIDEHPSPRQKREVEARLLTCKMAYEKAKAQLMCEKRKRFLKREQLFSSQIQDFHMLKLNYSRLSEAPRRDDQEDDCNQKAAIIDLKGKCEYLSQVPIDKGGKMEEVEALDRKVKRLSKFLSTYCKLKGEPSATATIALISDHLRKRQCCKLICHELQPWKVDDFERKDDHFNVLLNYRDYVTQRFSFKTGPRSSIIISKTLKNTNITESFPNMNIRTAFEFVLDVETTKKCYTSRYLSQETQITNSLLCNLLDVVEEIQIAKMEMTSLIQTSFLSPSDDQLDLQLCFIDFYSGKKVILTLDVSYLNRGVYPSEVIPYKIEAPAGTEYSLPESLINDIRTAAGSLKVGYSRILRLCRCVSHTIQATR